ncbi:MAG: GxxExxY protein [Planctomycetes bacterium]|nr:GxxExxY protein [Planctomycetota bacterium]
MNADRAEILGNAASSSGSLLFEDLTYGIRAAVFEVSTTLGIGFLEKVYENALVRELPLRGLNCTQQQPIRVLYKGDTVGDYVADIVVEGKVLLELKVVECINDLHRAQVLNYLKATGLQLGLLINFYYPKAQIVRLVQTDQQRRSNDSAAKAQ